MDMIDANSYKRNPQIVNLLYHIVYHRLSNNTVREEINC